VGVRDVSFELWPAADAASPPFRYDPIMSRRVAFWRVREANGRAIGQARTRAGARAAVLALYAARGMAR
jgi:hypothetical protein